MTATQTLTVRSARSTEEVSAACAVIAGAFEHDAITQHVFRLAGDDLVETFERLLQLQARTLYAPRGAVDLAVRHDAAGARIVGAALWAEPGAWDPGLLGIARHLPEYLRVLGPRVVRVARSEEALVRHHPRFPHWYLYTIGVSDAARGLGVGGRLLDHALERAGETPCYLESSSPVNQRLYERKGFLPLGSVRGHRGEHLSTGMWRPGRVRQHDDGAVTSGQ